MKIRKVLACAIVSSIALSIFSGCSEDDPLDGAVVGENSFIMTLYPDIAPITCENFQKLVDKGFYNGLTFHRIVDDFVVQGGDPNGDGTGASSESIVGEFSSNGVSNNLSHVRGTVSMARAEDYNSATCQFFICLSDLSYLDGSYAAFGNVTEGMDAVDKLLNVPRSVGRMGEISSPDTPVYIKYAETVEADSAGNPRIQFVIEIDDDSKENIKQSTVVPAEMITSNITVSTDITSAAADDTSSENMSSLTSTETEVTTQDENFSETETTTVDAVG
ncbi:MAG: peptidylprolyl isomerase [Ruminococcus sp.]|nr:peptidylprolyl isomerase [Ruminococcus sp.]